MIKNNQRKPLIHLRSRTQTAGNSSGDGRVVNSNGFAASVGVGHLWTSCDATVMWAIPPANVEYLAFRVARVGVDDTSAEKFVSGIVSLGILQRNLYASAKSCT